LIGSYSWLFPSLFLIVSFPCLFGLSGIWVCCGILVYHYIVAWIWYHNVGFVYIWRVSDLLNVFPKPYLFWGRDFY
jgi:hypothetical protein